MSLYSYTPARYSFDSYTFQTAGSNQTNKTEPATPEQTEQTEQPQDPTAEVSLLGSATSEALATADTKLMMQEYLATDKEDSGNGYAPEDYT